MLPSALMRPTTRGVLADVVDATPAAATFAAYPGTHKHRLLALRDSKPSLVAVPLATSCFCAPETVVGIAMDCTNAPVVEYSSINTAVPALDSALAPVPTR